MAPSRILCAVLALLLLSGPVGAGSTDTTVRDMTHWVAAEIEVPAPPPPVVARTDQADLRRRCFPGFRFEDAPGVRGAYDPATGVVLLDDACDLSRLEDASYLLHEIVHHVQLHNGLDKTARCRAELEGQAFRLQVQWLEEQGVADPLALLGTDERTLRMLETCPPR
ncbi:hypothetical protein C882_1364 [Caenispirillum salinarum AK4]|uniref:DUF6647 domain-containing protein n=1 Tax=Caenispirillum salinarum AK4 TaxID=1238182 RepID=K9HA91_9PROT|nr:DUF6647 family protein [Caenispirillum salinarum]EKV27518.1 hypothetical protein C882_1364 [Caenispirillum salinarum AK4]